MTSFQGGFRNPFVASSAQLADGVVTSIKLANTIQSDNFVTGVSGWQIDRANGDAEFNNIVARGDILANWDGSDPLDLSGGYDDTATTGLAIDGSEGTLQAMGDVWLGPSAFLSSSRWGATQGNNAEAPASRLTDSFIAVRTGVNITNTPEGVFLGGGGDVDGDSGGVPGNMYSYTGIAFGHTGTSSPFPSSREFYSLGIGGTPVDPLQADNYTGSPAAIFYSEFRDRLYISSPRTTIENSVIIENDLTVNDDLTVNGELYIDNTAGSANLQIVFNDTDYSIYQDNTGAGSDNSRLWISGPDQGEMVVGPRTGTDYIERFRVRADVTRIEGQLDLSGGDVTPVMNIADTSTQVKEGDGNSVRLATGNGYVDIGPQNTGFGHIYTDRARFAFNKSLATVGSTGYQHLSLPTYNNVNGSMRWMGTSTDMGQAHTSSSIAHKKQVAPVDMRKSVFMRMAPIWFKYDDKHPYRDRWKGAYRRT